MRFYLTILVAVSVLLPLSSAWALKECPGSPLKASFFSISPSWHNCEGTFINTDKGIDFLLGYRKFSKPMPHSRIISNTITSKIISILKSKIINDSQCGYRRYKIDAIKNLVFVENGYLFESEILLNSINKNISIENINIRVIYDNSPSHINKVNDSLNFIRLITRYIFA